jgi:hypothetical protein
LFILILYNDGILNICGRHVGERWEIGGIIWGEGVGMVWWIRREKLGMWKYANN